MIHIGLFEGIGGFSLAAHWAGWETYATCEINPFGQQVLKYHFPQAYHHGDIKTLNYETIHAELSARFGSEWRNQPVIITGGFPCQPFSLAGKRKGTEDDRHLWPEMLRIIHEVKPEWIVGENVFGIINWSEGMVFEQVQSDLEAEGYEVQPYVLPACAVNAPHRRDRVWFVAHYKIIGGSTRERENSDNREWQDSEQIIHYGEDIRNRNNTTCISRTATDTGLFGQEKRQEQPMGVNELCKEWDVADTASNGYKNRHQESRRFERKSEEGRMFEFKRGSNKWDVADTDIAGWTQFKFAKESKEPGYNTRINNKKLPTWSNFPTQSPIRTGNDGIPTGLAGITVSKHRNESIKAAGNAIVPQVALQIFNAINEYEPRNTNRQTRKGS